MAPSVRKFQGSTSHGWRREVALSLSQKARGWEGRFASLSQKAGGWDRLTGEVADADAVVAGRLPLAPEEERVLGGLLLARLVRLILRKRDEWVNNGS